MKTPHISDEAVAANTGKIGSEWFSILDHAGAQKMNHKEIVAVLNTAHAIDPWWQQSVNVTYENARGLREKTPNGGWIPNKQEHHPICVC